MNSYSKPSYGTNYLAYAKPDICPIGPTQTKESPCDFPPPNFDAIFQIVSPLKIALAAAACLFCWTANQRIEAASHSPFEDLSKRLSKRISDGRLLGSENAAVERSAFFDSLTMYSATPTLAEPQRVGGNGVTPPECLDCPVPQFRHRADASSRAMLSVGVSSEGRVVAVKVLRGAGPEFADEAWGMLRVFRYNPAHDRSGHPVAVSIFVEIFFS